MSLWGEWLRQRRQPATTPRPAAASGPAGPPPPVHYNCRCVPITEAATALPPTSRGWAMRQVCEAFGCPADLAYDPQLGQEG